MTLLWDSRRFFRDKALVSVNFATIVLTQTFDQKRFLHLHGPSGLSPGTWVKCNPVAPFSVACRPDPIATGRGRLVLRAMWDLRNLSYHENKLCYGNEDRMYCMYLVPLSTPLLLTLTLHYFFVVVVFVVVVVYPLGASAEVT